ncbi:MAG: hypothetical protein HGA45_10320 [Chloroflexales bacterium]|nr:hypothetical protein [Chloroflexales bacterium]
MTMKLHGSRRTFALGFTLVLATLLGAFAFRSAAQDYNKGALLFALSTDGEARCARTGRNAPRVYQTKEFGVALRQFWDNEQTYLSIVFPDGRVFSPGAAGMLDGVIDMPPNFPWVATTSNGGDFYAPFMASAKWPRGCYELTALGGSSNRLASGFFVLDSLPMGPLNSGRAELNIEDNTTGDPSGLHGTTVNLHGRGFVGQEYISIWITAPDGTVIDYPMQLTSDVGSFASSFTFDSRFQTGRYSFTALGQSSGYQVIDTFDLAARNTAPNSYALLVVNWKQPAQNIQGGEFEITGQFFLPLEPVVVWLTLPDNSVRTLPDQYTNVYGEFFTDIFFDERLPTGTYKFTAKGVNSGRTVISNDVAVLQPGDPVINTSPPLGEPGPIVDDNNTFGAGEGGAIEGPGLPPNDPPALEPYTDLEPLRP